MPRINSTESLQVAIIEVGSIYHAIRYNQSYLSLDCFTKLYPNIFPDSKLALKVHCGRTKREAIVRNILCPKSLEMVLNELKTNNESIFFSIATDASNNGNRKLFPI